VRGAPATRLHVLDLELASHLEELEARADLDLLGRARANARLHRRAEALDVQAHASPARGLPRLRSLARVPRLHQRSQGIDAAAVEGRERDAEIAPLGAFGAPGDDALDHDLSTVILEAAHERRPLLGQVGRSEVHALGAHVERFGFECRDPRLVAADLDQGLERHTARPFGAAFFGVGHG
jgi:hypothetical protein